MLLVDLAAGVGTGDEFLARLVREAPARVVVVANKEDLVRRDFAVMSPQLTRLAELLPNSEIIPTSAMDGFNVQELLDLIVGMLPRGPRIFPGGVVTDQPDRQFAAEVLREKFLGQLRDELPHSLAVVVTDIRDSEGRDDMIDIDAVAYVERDSQKGIIIGKGGATLRDAATAARKELQAVFGTKVYLDVRVKVAKEWQRDPRQMRRMGY